MTEPAERLMRGRGDAVHRPTCCVARRDGMVRWLWAEGGDELRWENGHPVRRDGNATVTVVWLRACQRCRPDLGGGDD